MVARFVRKSGICILLVTLLLSQVFADESNTQRGATELARKNFMQALAVMGEAVESCEDKEKIIDIPRWEQIGVSRESLLLGIVYFNLKLSNECTALAAKDLLIASKILELGSSHDREKEPSRKFIDMILDSWWKELEAEAQYRYQVPTDIQKRIEMIHGLKEPFDMIKSWDASGN
ncbi:MAG: hypothetical protein P8179_24250 [Candidatus Thiodiazotropha sp.]|jgi:hypothetical protein